MFRPNTPAGAGARWWALRRRRRPTRPARRHRSRGGLVQGLRAPLTEWPTWSRSATPVTALTGAWAAPLGELAGAGDSDWTSSGARRAYQPAESVDLQRRSVPHRTVSWHALRLARAHAAGCRRGKHFPDTAYARRLALDVAVWITLERLRAWSWRRSAARRGHRLDHDAHVTLSGLDRQLALRCRRGIYRASCAASSVTRVIVSEIWE